MTQDVIDYTHFWHIATIPHIRVQSIAMLEY